MKDFAKNRLMPFLLVAITALCALFCVILTTPNTVKADASTTPYDKDLGFEVIEGENLFGKYVGICYMAEDNYASFTVNGGDWEFSINDAGEVGLSIFSSGGGNQITNEIDFDVEFEEDTGTHYAILDFTKEYSFNFDVGTGENVNVVLNEETLVVKAVNCLPVLMFYPTSDYITRPLVAGENLANKTIITPFYMIEEGHFWEMELEGCFLYAWDSEANVHYVEKENGENIFDELAVHAGVHEKLGYDLWGMLGFPNSFILRFPEQLKVEDDGVIYEGLPVFKSVIVDGFENNFRVFEFIEDDTPTETPDTPNEPTDGEQPKDDNGKASFLDDVANWFDNAGETVSNWLGERNIEISGRGVLVAGVVLAVVIWLFRRGRRRK